MLSVHIPAVLVKGSLFVASAIGIATLTTAPATANTARGMLSYSTHSSTAAISSELSSSAVVTGSRFQGQVNLLESGVAGNAELNVTTRPEVSGLGNGSLQSQVVQTLSQLDVTKQQELGAYVGILQAAAGTDGLEDATGAADGDVQTEIIGR
jgi:hypothetical protein